MSFSMIQRQHRLEQFIAYKKVAEAIGYGRHKECDFRTRATLDSDGNQEAAAGSEWTLPFLADTDTTVLAKMTRDPKPSALAKGLPNEFMCGFRSITAVIDQQLTTLTKTELMEIASKSGEMIVVIKQGDQVLYERSLAKILRGVPGVVNRADATNAAAGTPNVNVQAELVPSDEGDDFDDPIVIFPQGSLTLEIKGQGAWTTTDDIVFEIQLHGWVSTQGMSVSAAKVGRLSELAAETKQQLMNRARV